MSALAWLIKLPFRPVMRWITALVVIVLGLGWWSGYLDLAARHVFWRYWNYSTPLIDQAPADAKSLLLVDMTRPGIAHFAPLAKTERVRKAMENLATTLDIVPQYDLLQMMFVVDSTGQKYTFYSGRFMVKSTREALESQGWRAQKKGAHILFGKADSKTAWLWMRQNLMLYGPLDALAKLAKQGQFAGSIISDAQFMADLQTAGNRHVVTGLIREAAKNKASRLVLTVDSQNASSDAQAAQILLAAHIISQDAKDSQALQKDLQTALGAIKRAAALLAGDEVNTLLQSSEVHAEGTQVIVQSHCSAEQLAAIVGKSNRPSSLLNLTAGVGIKALVGGLQDLLR